eukprot:652376-Rhodomonas_salina.5
MNGMMLMRIWRSVWKKGEREKVDENRDAKEEVAEQGRTRGGGGRKKGRKRNEEGARSRGQK